MYYQEYNNYEDDGYENDVFIRERRAIKYLAKNKRKRLRKIYNRVTYGIF